MSLLAAGSLPFLSFCRLGAGDEGLGLLYSPLTCVLLGCVERPSGKSCLPGLQGGFGTEMGPLQSVSPEVKPGPSAPKMRWEGRQGSQWCPQEQGETVPAQVTLWCSASPLQYGRYIRSALRQEKGLSAIADLLTHDSERVVKAASGALRNLAVDLRNKELIGEGCGGEDIKLSVPIRVRQELPPDLGS